MTSVEDEWERALESDEDLDLLFVTYRAGQVPVARMTEIIAEHGFKAEVRP